MWAVAAGPSRATIRRTPGPARHDRRDAARAPNSSAGRRGRAAVADGVVALDPARPGRRRAARLGARRPHRPAAGRRPHPPVLAVRRSGRPGALADRGAPRARRPRRLGVRARRARDGRRVRVRGPRNHFPLEPAAALPVHRRRHRHHPDPARCSRAADAGRRAAGGCSTAGAPRASMAFRDELARYGDRVRVRPQDETGLLDLAASLGRPEPGTLVYCCGPGAAAGRGRGPLRGWPPGCCTSSGSRPRSRRPAGPRGAASRSSWPGRAAR